MACLDTWGLLLSCLGKIWMLKWKRVIWFRLLIDKHGEWFLVFSSTLNIPFYVCVNHFRYFDYLFYIDFEASMAESRAQNALGHLQVFTRYPCTTSWFIFGLSKSSLLQLFQFNYKKMRLMNHESHSDLLEYAQEFATFLRVLGCYPMDKIM